MTDLRTCAAMMALGFATPRDAVYYVNGNYRECDIHDPNVQTLQQFWCGVYARYCAIHYSLNLGSKIRIVVRWDDTDVDSTMSTECHSRSPYDEPMDSRVFFRLLSGISPDSVRTDVPLDWETLSPALEFCTAPQPAEEPTYEELL